ncbi:LuxR C-terminal-related transcriptional regulator [Streptosporangium sp. NBC_01810]|uniref:LuxR C-terminal-related transcriptional regulator n=1 Tax=Streptosporangium sp. NBC_01810 TaxID=2975951 RepID=UPI002DDBB9DA|nr:LuxR C-terminal-related transcriptional regulator [Streptosporangium sp. NBC_01810]WSA23182.1 LuxR C-terminal-related transcriptional regulator [Streptosporangium sp. NBC_01810]
MLASQHRSVLDVLKGLLAESSAGNGRLVLVSGGLASGKTELLHEFSRVAADSGALLLSATGSVGENTLQAGMIDQLFHGAGLPPEVSDQVSRLIRRHTVTTDATRQAEAEVVREIGDVLLELSRERPVVIGVDAVHLVDGLSLRLLLYLCRRISSARILLIMNEWDLPQSTIPSFYAEVTRGFHRRIWLTPLSACDIAEVLPAPVDPALATALHRLSGGNPMLVNALIDDHHADPGGRTAADGTARPAVGVAYAQAVMACLHRWEPELLGVARALAVLGEPSSAGLTGGLAKINPKAAERAVEAMTEAGLLAGGWFRHPVAAAAVLDGIGAEERSCLHVRAAGLLYRRGMSTTKIAAHFVAADRAPEDWATGVLRDAAEQALAGNEVAVAVQCLELALRSVRDEGERLAITKVLVRALWRVNPSAAALHLPLLREALQQGCLFGQDAAAVVRHSLWNGDVQTASRAMEALTATPDLLNVQTAAELHLTYQWFYGTSRGPHGRFDTASAWGDEARRMTTIWTHGDNEAALVSAENILQSCRLGETTLEVVAIAMLTLMYGGRMERAIHWCDELIDEAVRSGTLTWQAVLGAVRADIALRQGEVVVAAARAQAALELMQVQSWGILIGYPRTTLLLANTAMGRYQEGAELLQQRVPDEMFATLIGLLYLHARGHYYLATDRVLAAISDFQTCGRLMQDWELDRPMLVPWRSDLAEANLRLSRWGVARDLVGEQIDRLKPIDLRTRGISLLILAAASGLAQRPALLREAVDCLRTAGDRLLLSRALTDLGAALQQLGESDEAQPLNCRAMREAAICYSGVLPLRLSRSWSTGPVLPDPGETAEESNPLALSDSECRVAELAALGHTNREISRTLHITVSTVEQHLTRVYRKLGVKSRADLPPELAPPDRRASAGPPEAGSRAKSGMRGIAK